MLDEAFQETWESVLEPYASDPGRAFILAQSFSVLQETLAKGPQGTQEVIAALKLGIQELYQYTDVYQANLTLYQRLVSEEGLDPNLDPRKIVQKINKSAPAAQGQRERPAKSKNGQALGVERKL